MKKIDDPSTVRTWSYHDARLAKGFVGTRDHIITQTQEAYLQAGLEFRTHEIPALIDDFMCSQGLAKPCSERIDGLGDVVHCIVKPVAKVIDYLAGTNLTGCTGCSKRREELNQHFPL